MKNTKALSKGFRRLLVTWQAKSKLDKPASRSGAHSGKFTIASPFKSFLQHPHTHERRVMDGLVPLSRHLRKSTAWWAKRR